MYVYIYIHIYIYIYMYVLAPRNRAKKSVAEARKEVTKAMEAANDNENNS